MSGGTEWDERGGEGRKDGCLIDRIDLAMLKQWKEMRNKTTMDERVGEIGAGMGGLDGRQQSHKVIIGEKSLAQ